MSNHTNPTQASGSGYSIPRSFIKNVAIQLRTDYELSSNPFVISDPNDEKERSASEHLFYIGRKNHIKKFKAFLKSSKKGIYLITGYRGMGKTSFVNHVINEFLREDKEKKDKANTKYKTKIEPIHLTLAQSNPKEIDVLKQVVSSIHTKYKPECGDTLAIINMFRKYLLWFLLLLLSILVLPKMNPRMEYSFTCLEVPMIRTMAIGFAVLLLLAFIAEYIDKGRKGKNAIDTLLARCYATTSEEHSWLTNLGINGMFGSIGRKSGRNYPIANSKEIEFELLQFLKEVRNRYEFIFIFDELDKIELQYMGLNLNEDLESFENRNQNHGANHSLRNRRQAVISIITGLKNFFTTADARFVFIAGREMFDASLADISDKQSPLGSIFTYVFHIESLLKEHGNDGKNTSSLSVGIEEFLKFQLLSKNEVDDAKKGKIPSSHGLNIESFSDVLTQMRVTTNNDEHYLQIYFLLQGFITYLVYRSSGSPKKLIKAFQEFVFTQKEFEKEKVTVQKNRGGCGKDSTCYLYFNHNDQYRIGFINSIYRPYIIQNGRSYKMFSENTVISVPYLFDHLFKFHPFAFSISHLELIPEMLSSNKTPSLKRDLRQVINYLYQGHIRDTDVELFDYKFNSKTANEITFLSRVFEEEAAAFNFTLDESYPVKALLTEKIKELRSIHTKFSLDSEKFNLQIFSIANLNCNLGDIYFFDQEFDSALNCYSDAIRSINNLDFSKINFRDFITLVRCKLKIGLCLEKINSYDEALSFYSDSVQDIKRYFYRFMTGAKYISFSSHDILKTSENKNAPETETFYTSALNDILQICVQSFLSSLYIQEKIGIEGVSTSKVRVEFSDFLHIATEVGLHCGRNHLIIANSMLHHGKMLYYKNSQVPTRDVLIPMKSNEYPLWFRLRGHEIKKYIKFSNEDRRQPILALRVYLLGLDEVLLSREFYKDLSVGNNDISLLYKCAEYYEEKDNTNGIDNTKDRKTDAPMLINYYLNNVDQLLQSNPSSKEIYTGHHLKYIAGFLAAIGDCILGLDDLKIEDPDKKNQFQVAIDKMFNFSNQSEGFNGLLTNETPKLSIATALRCYYYAAKFYEEYGRTSSAIFEYRKILQTIMITAKTTADYKKIKSLIDHLQKDVVDKAFQLSHAASGRTERHMVLKVNNALTDANQDMMQKQWDIPLNIPNSAELREIQLIFEYIKLKIEYYNAQNKLDITRYVKSLYAISTQSLRITELDFYCRYLYKEIKPYINKIDDEEVIRESDFPHIRQHLIEFLYSKNKIIRTLKIYETDYTFGPGFLAYMHFSIAHILNKKVHRNTASPGSKDITLAQLIKNEKDGAFAKELQKFLGDQSLVLFDAQYHFGMARDNYRYAIELHTAGSEYRKQIKDMIYLEDDFNDNAYHFGAACERYLMINDFFQKQIETIDVELAKK